MNVRETVVKVLKILEENQNSYIDPSEHIYDAKKRIKRHLDDEDLIMYVGDFIWGLNSSVNGDFDGTLAKCVEMLNALDDTKEAPQNYTGIAEGTEPFRMKSLTPEEKTICIEKIDLIMDNLDDIQGLLGAQEYAKQIAHWQAVNIAVKNEF